MPLTIENSAALVVGGGAADMKAQATPPATMDVIVERPFYFNREPTRVGAKVTLPKVFALEMLAAKKVSMPKEEPAPPPPPPPVVEEAAPVIEDFFETRVVGRRSSNKGDLK